MKCGSESEVRGGAFLGGVAVCEKEECAAPTALEVVGLITQCLRTGLNSGAPPALGGDGGAGEERSEKRRRERNVLALGRKSPPYAKPAKDGAPSSTGGLGVTGRRERSGGNGD